MRIIQIPQFDVSYYVNLHNTAVQGCSHTTCIVCDNSCLSFQGHEKDRPCKAAAQPLLCSVGAVCHLHHQHCLNWCTCALWSGLCSHALLLPGCVLLDGSRSHSVTQEIGDCVQTRHHQLCCHCHGLMLG